MIQNILLLIACIIICEIAGAIGALFNKNSFSKSGWYAKIKKPSFNPPNWIFAPVWILLYLLMGVSLYLVLDTRISLLSFPIIIFLVQLLLNMFWTGIFFGLRKPGYAFIEIVLMWLAIVATIIIFYPISKLASYLLIPYFLWVSFASILNFSIWWLNKE